MQDVYTRVCMRDRTDMYAACVYACMYVRTWAYIFIVHMHTYIRTYIHSYTMRQRHAYMHIHIHMHMHMHIHIDTYTYVYRHVCVCICVYIYRYPAAQDSGHLCPGHAARTAAPLASIERLKVASILQHRSLGLVDVNTFSLL